jgi:hypothetical protein
VAIIGGLLAFLLAGLKLRSVDRRLHPLDPPLDRHLDSPVDNLA